MALNPLPFLRASWLISVTDHAPPKQAATTCPADAVPWSGGCFYRDEWRSDPNSCPDGVIVIPKGEDHPRCTPCDSDKVTMQQPWNYCAGPRAQAAERELDRAFRAVLKEFPNRARDLRKAEAAWVKWRDAECEAERKQYDGGSMAPLVDAECRREKTRERIEHLKRLRDRWTSP